MPAYYSKETNTSILYIHIPKCGGGSVEEFFKNNHYRQFMWTAKPWRLSKCSSQHMHASMLETYLNIDRFDYVFTVVRNPVHRMISEYKWRIRREIAKDGFNPWYKATREEFEKDNFFSDNHIRPMHEFITKQCHVFKLEDGLDHLPDTIKTGLQSSKKIVNWENPAIRNQKENVHSKRLTENPDLKERYENSKPSEQTLQDIFKDYENDFKFFNYSMDPKVYLA